MIRNPSRRGNVSIEYVLLFSLIGSVAMLQLEFPNALGNLVLRANDNMPTPTIALDGADPGATPIQPAYNPPTPQGPGGGEQGPDYADPGAPPVVPPAEDPRTLTPWDGGTAPETTPPPTTSTGGGGGTYTDPVTVDPNGTITYTTPATTTLSVLGSAIQYGAGGAQVPVKLELVINGVAQTLFSGKGSQITAATGASLANVPAGTTIEFRGTSYNTNGSVLYTVSTASTTPMIIALRNGDYVPDMTPFGQQPTIKSFLASVIDPVTKRVTIGANEVLFLMELGTNNTKSSAADFQDLVFKATFTDADTADGVAAN